MSLTLVLHHRAGLSASFGGRKPRQIVAARRTAGLVRDFKIQTVLSTTPPITYTMPVDLSAVQAHTISTMPNTTLAE